MKPANYYASTTAIPSHIESRILSLKGEERLHLASDLIDAMRGDDAIFLADTDESRWLRSQGYESLCAVLKWIVSELI